MGKFFMVALLCVSFSLTSAPAVARSSGAGQSIDNKQFIAAVGGGLLGLFLASGAAGMISTAALMSEGAGLAEALEVGAGLGTSAAVLSVVFGGIFAHKFVMRGIDSINGAGDKAAAH